MDAVALGGEFGCERRHLVDEQLTQAVVQPTGERRAVLDPLVDELVARFRPQTDRYWELWIDGEPAVTADPVGVADGQPSPNG